MKTRLFTVVVFLLLTFVSVMPIMGAEEKFPNRPIDIIVPWGPGGGLDLMGRKIGTIAEKFLGIPLPVSNVPGASGSVGVTKLMDGKADGYTVATVPVDIVTNIVTGGTKAKIEDFTWLCRLHKLDSYFFVRSDSPFKTIQDLLDYAKANPKKIRVGMTGFGSPDDLTVLYLASKGYAMIGAPYPQAGERYASTVGGHTEVLYEQASDVQQFLDSKQLRPLVVFSRTRSEFFPDVPCSKEVGLDIYLTQWRSLAAKAGTPNDRVKVLVDAFAKAVETREWKADIAERERYIDADSFMGGPEKFGEWVKGESNIYTALFKSFEGKTSK